MNKRLLALAATAGLGIGAAVAVTVPAGATTPACRASQLQPHYDGQDGASAIIGDRWHFTNVGSTCQTIGFVGALDFAADGRPYPTTVHWTGTKHTVVLAHGRTARWEFIYSNPAFSGCTPQAAARMIVTPPNNTSPVLASRGERTCNGDFDATPLVYAG